jgi:sucrose phosphorylase
VQLFLPGIPQVYYVGLLAGHNDMALLAQTRVGRDINRHHYTAVEIQQDLQRPVVRELCSLLRLRNTHPAFAGRFEWSQPAPSRLCLGWQHGAAAVTLEVDFSAGTHRISATPQREAA